MASRPPKPTTEDAAIATTSEIFPDGIIDLVLRDIRTGPELLLWAREKCVIAPEIKHEGSTYRVPYLHPSIVKATRLASGISDYGTTQQLIESIEGLLQEFVGIPTTTAHLLVLWILSTWLADCVPSPPCLVVSGFDMGLAVKLFLLLKCLVRRPLLLTEIHRAGFCSLMTPLHPTVLLNQPGLSRKLRAFFRTSNFPGLVVPASGGVVGDVSGPRAIFVGADAASDPWSDATLHVALLPASDALPLLDASTQRLIADEYLPKLLLYRLRNVPKMQASMVSKDPSRPADADTFRACILDAPDFTQAVLPLLEAQREDAISQVRLDPDRAIVEVLWTPTHEKADMSPTRIADLMNALLRCRGEVREFTAEEVGWRLRHLGLYREREGGGMVLRACRENSQRIHLLARQFGLDLPPAVGCPDCAPPEVASEWPG
jgi:hypothetical protein